MADIRDLAEHLGISIGTVSRALNNRPGVNAQTRDKVLQAALALGYVANQSGRALRRGATNTIGFVIETGSAANQESGEFFFVLLDALHVDLARRGYDLVILPCHSADDPVEYLARLVARGIVDALIITATRRQDRRIGLLSKSGLPFITLGRSETEAVFPWIDLDFEGAATRSVRELTGLGHRRIAVGLPENDAMLGHHYLRGFREAMAVAGLPVDDSLIFRVPTSEAGGFALGRQVLTASPPPGAVILCSEAATVGLYASLTRGGLTPGVDISVITFRENLQLRFLAPAPACFRVDVASVGRMLADGVMRLVKGETGPQDSAPTGQLVAMEFVPGASVGPPSVSGDAARPLAGLARGGS